MYTKKDRRFVLEEIPKTYWSGRPYVASQKEKEAVAKGRGNYEPLNGFYVGYRKFAYIQKKKQEDKIRTDEDCQFHKIKYINHSTLPSPWDDLPNKAFINESKTWKRHTKCRKQWQKNLKKLLTKNFHAL